MSGKFGADLEDKCTGGFTGFLAYTPSLWETDLSEGLRAGFALKSWLGCCQPSFQGTWPVLVVAFPNHVVSPFTCKPSPLTPSPAEYFMLQILKKRNLTGPGQATLTYL